MNKYEIMCILKPDLPEEERKTLCGQLSDIITKNGGEVVQAAVWSERRKMYFPLKRFHEGVYYLINLMAPPEAIKEIRQAYGLNENLLRFLISAVDKGA